MKNINDMKTLEKVKVLLMALFVIVTCTSITACGGDDGDDGENTEFPDYEGQEPTKVNNNGHAYVDLGLSAYWATCNIGAYSPYENGNYYAFGENSTKTDYTKSNYRGENNDVAKSMWGGDWRLPTKEEINELISNCYFKVVEKSGKDIMYIKGPNGNAIELPYAGSKVNGDGNKGGFYWSSSLAISEAWCLHFNYNEAKCSEAYKYCGLTVRAVMTNPNYNKSNNNTGSGNTGGSGGSSITYEKPEIGLENYTCYTTSITVKYRIYNQDKAKVTSAKGYYGTSSASISTSASVAGSLITIRITGLKKGTTYYVKCSATGKGGTTTSDVTKLITDY